MGLLLKLLSLVRTERNGVTVTDITADPGGGANVTAEQFQPSGEDSQPLPGDYILGVSIPTSGGKAAVGFIDPANAPKSGPGEVRRYARNASGAPVAELWIKNDGSVTIKNDDGSFDLTTAGIIELNGNTDNAVRFLALQTGFNLLRTELNAFITKYNAHTHGDPVPVTPTTTAASAAVPAGADITAAKVDEVKVP